MWCVLGEATPNELVFPEPNPDDVAPVLGDGWSAPCPDEVAMPDEGAMGEDGSMAISQGTQSFVLVQGWAQFFSLSHILVPLLHKRIDFSGGGGAGGNETNCHIMGPPNTIISECSLQNKIHLNTLPCREWC